MNRQQAIEKATHFRQGKDVLTILTERTSYIPAVAEVKDEKGNITQEAKKAIQASERTYQRETYLSINDAKKRMRNLGIGVALTSGDVLPK